MCQCQRRVAWAVGKGTEQLGHQMLVFSASESLSPVLLGFLELPVLLINLSGFFPKDKKKKDPVDNLKKVS